MRQLLGRIDEPDLALTVEIENVVGLALCGLGDNRETERNVRGDPGLVVNVGKIDRDRARRVNPRALTRARKLFLIGESIHDLFGRERHCVVPRQRLHIAGDERGEDVVVRHQDEFLIRVLTGDAHQDVEELRIARVSAHVPDIKKV